MAARSLVNFIGTVGEVIDEGTGALLKGWILKADEPSDHDRKFAAALRKAMAEKRYADAHARLTMAMWKTVRANERMQDSYGDMFYAEKGIDDDLLFEVYASNADDYIAAKAELDKAMKEEASALEELRALGE